MRRSTLIRVVALTLAVAGLALAWVTQRSWWSRGNPNAMTFPTTRPGLRLAVLLTGDIGISSDVRKIAESLAGASVPTLVLAPSADDESPEQASSRVDRLIREYKSTWRRDRLVVVGLDRGAGMAPFVANRIGADLRQRIDALVLVAPPARVAFRSRWRDALSLGPRLTDLPVLPELERLHGTTIVCLSESTPREILCPQSDARPPRLPVSATHRARGKRVAPSLAEQVLNSMH